MRRTRWAVAQIAILLVLASQAAFTVVQWHVTRTEHFIIYHTGNEATARRVADHAERWHSILSSRLKFSPGAITPIYLYPDRSSFSRATGVEPGERIVGLAHTRTHKVQVDASGAFGDIEGVIPHELVHVFLSHYLRGNSPRLPLWMHEGLAKYLADDWTGADVELLAHYAAGGRLMPLDSLRRTFPSDEEQRAVAYVQSYSAVKYMADTYSPQSLLDLLSEMRSGKLFDEALFLSIGRKPAEFEDEWRQYLWEEYALDRWIKLGMGFVSFFMAVSAILAFRARMAHKRRKALEFEEEDLPEGEERDG